MKDTSYVLVQCPVPAADRQTSKFDISIMNKISLISSTWCLLGFWAIFIILVYVQSMYECMYLLHIILIYIHSCQTSPQVSTLHDKGSWQTSLGGLTSGFSTPHDDTLIQIIILPTYSIRRSHMSTLSFSELLPNPINGPRHIIIIVYPLFLSRRNHHGYCTMMGSSPCLNSLFLALSN